jgi:peptidyl-prolyl cis-trans isomerase C
MTLVGLAGLVCACSGSDSNGNNTLAKINDRTVSLEEFTREMERVPTMLKPLLVSVDGKKEFLQRLIDQELLVQEGMKRGLHEDQQVLDTVKAFKRQLIIEHILKALYEGKDEVSDEEVERYYVNNKERFLLGERVRVHHIVVKTLPVAQEVKRRLYDGADFETLAKQYSISPTGPTGGDLGYIERGQVGKEFEEAAFSLTDPEEISDIVKTNFGYHLIRLDDRKRPYQRTLEEVREQIRNFLKEKKREEILAGYLNDLRQKADITVHEELLKADTSDT